MEKALDVEQTEHVMRFTKMHGLGNDYVYVNCFDRQVQDPPSLARAVSDRHLGVGSDGLILIRPSNRADVRMEIYNADGSRAEMCGNGVRCVGKYAAEHGLIRRAGKTIALAGPRLDDITVETDSGVLTLGLFVDNGKVTRVRVDMGPPGLQPESLPTRLAKDQMIRHRLNVRGRQLAMTCVSMGNPHAVFFVDDLDAIELPADGPFVENHQLFPRRVNAHFVQVNSDTDVTMITWERGSGATLACGTGAAAVCVAGVLERRTQRHITAHLPGGDLWLQWREHDDHVFLTGPAKEVFTGQWPEG